MIRYLGSSASKKCASWTQPSLSCRPTVAMIRPYGTFWQKENTHQGASQGRLAATTAAVFFTVVGSSCSINAVQCDGDPSNTSAVGTESATDAPAPEADVSNDDNTNPLWPCGVSPDMVNSYVDEIIDNPEINISAIPDSVERLIYISTVRLTLNALYSGLSMLHGEEILAHQLKLIKAGSGEKLKIQHSTGKINSAQLEELATRLLNNKDVNQGWLPDRVEREVYINCLKLVFSLLDTVADTLSIRLCGHELSLSFEPLSSSIENIGEAQTMELDEAILDELVTETIQQSQDAFVGTSLASYLPFYQDFVQNLHKTLYALILGILSDMLSKTELAVLEERIQIRLVPMDVTSWRKSREKGVDNKTSQEERIAQLEKELEEAHDSEARARRMAGMGLFAAAIATTVAALLQLDD